MKCKEPGAQKARHIMKIGELSSTARRRNSPAQPINQRFPKRQTAIQPEPALVLPCRRGCEPVW